MRTYKKHVCEPMVACESMYVNPCKVRMYVRTRTYIKYVCMRICVKYVCKPMVACEPIFTFRVGFVHPLQDVALHQYLPLSSVCCFPVPGGFHLPCYVVLSSSAWSSSWSLPSHFCFSVHSMMSIIFVLFLISEHGILSCNFRSNIFLSIALWAVFRFLSIVYWETMFGSHRSLLARHTGPLTVFFFLKWNEELSILEYFLGFFFFFFFSKTAPCCSDPGIYFFFWSAIEVYGLSEVFEFCHFFNFVPDQLVYFHCLHGLSCTLSFPCVFLSQI